MTKPNATEIVVVLDRSGSMEAIRVDMEGGFNSFIAEQRKQPGECRVTLYQFDDTYEEVYAGRHIASVPPLALVPRGMTALNDGVGRAIVSVGDRLKALPEWERPSKVVFMVITDGQENASKEFTGEQIAKMVKHQTDTYSWAFIYLGSDLKTASHAQAINMRAARYQASGAGNKALFAAVGQSVSSYRNSEAMDWNAVAPAAVIVPDSDEQP